ncbi:hypothetical protein D3C81_833740 [compost metagenome]
MIRILSIPPTAEESNKSFIELIPNRGTQIQKNSTLNGSTYLIRHALSTPVINCPGRSIGVT